MKKITFGFVMHNWGDKIKDSKKYLFDDGTKTTGRFSFFMYILWRAATVRPMMCDLMGGLAVDSLLRSVGAVPELCRALRQVTLLQCIL